LSFGDTLIGVSTQFYSLRIAKILACYGRLVHELSIIFSAVGVNPA
jgi:hypothetical protein